MKEALLRFKGKQLLEATGNSKIEKGVLVNKKLTDIRTWGKHLLLYFPGRTIRIHLLLFGSYSIDEHTKTDRSLRLMLRFNNGTVYFYTCAVKYLEAPADEVYDWSADVMNDSWDAKKALKKLREKPAMIAADALLDQDIFSGVGNIIKNEVLYRVKIHPESKVGKIPAAKLREMVKEARNYSFDFLEWKKAFVLSKHWLAHKKKICKRCDLPIKKTYPGKTKRRAFYCTNCQVKY